MKERFVERLEAEGKLVEKSVEDLTHGDKLIVPSRGVCEVSGIRAADRLDSFPTSRTIIVDFGVGMSPMEFPRGAKVQVVKKA